MTLSAISVDWIMLLVDRSGSMAAIADATLRGMQTFVRQQRERPDVQLSVVAFGTNREDELQLTTLLDTRIAASGTRAIVPSMYRPEGDTPLLAAVWTAINRLEQRAGPHDRVLLAIMTDGHENASPKRFTKAGLRSRIRRKIGEGWLFVYLGAELEAWRTGEDMGFGSLNALSWSPTAEGVQGVFRTLADSTRRWTGSKALTSGKPAERFFPLQLPAPRE